MPQKLSRFAKLTIFGVALIVMSFVGDLHQASVLTDAAVEKELRPKRVAEMYGHGHRPDMPQRLVLLHPMECDATMNVRVYYVETGKTRCYSRSAQ